MPDRATIKSAIDAGGGMLRLEPSWVPRSFMIPGERLKLHPRDLYALGGHRGGINERWFSSTTNADNGPGTPADEGLSYVRLDDGSRFLLKEAVEKSGDLLLGAAVMEREKGWNLLCKFFDNMGPIPHHMHQTDAQAKLLGRKGKPEAYYFPPQYNKTDNNFPHTFMGLAPGTTKADVRRCLENWNKGDNGILFLSSAFRLEPGTGWQIDPGILHAPGSLVTYEPQVASDVFAMFQSEVEGRITPWALMTKDVARVSPGSRLSRRAARLGRKRQSKLRRRQPLLPETREAVCRNRGRRLSRAVDHLRHGLVLREGAHGPTEAHRDDKGRRRVRDYPDAGLWPIRSARGVDALDDPVRTDDGGRALRHRRRGAQGVKIQNLSATDRSSS